MSDELKFCKDCKHFQDGKYVPVLCDKLPAKCSQLAKRDLIYGTLILDYPNAMRMEGGACGPEGLLWEEKPAPEVVLPEKPPVSTWEAHPAPEIQRLQAELASAQELKGQWWEFWK